MYYHASRIGNIKKLEPSISNHGIPLVYFSSRRENALVYLSNAIEKYCKDTNFRYNGIYKKWASYGFTKDGLLELQEYYPNAAYETYKGVDGYIYKVENVPGIEEQKDIPYAFHTDKLVEVLSVEYIKDAYEEIMKEIKNGKIVFKKYEDFIKEKRGWLERTIRREYKKSIDSPEYRYFLENKFPFINDKNN